jgi:hypothetical protein
MLLPTWVRIGQDKSDEQWGVDQRPVSHGSSIPRARGVVSRTGRGAVSQNRFLCDENGRGDPASFECICIRRNLRGLSERNES